MVKVAPVCSSGGADVNRVAKNLSALPVALVLPLCSLFFFCGATEHRKNISALPIALLLPLYILFFIVAPLSTEKIISVLPIGL
jgi:hypothetical protein